LCGIAGFIGTAKHPQVSFALLTAIFEHSESRGVDASGFWGIQKGESGKILYHKEPLRSSVFVKKDIWKKVAKYDPDLIMVHARGASSGVGVPSVNKNNHPFVSNCKNIGLVHNGRIPDYEYQSLKKKYAVKTTCDSEILLRIFESGKLSSDENGIETHTKDDSIMSRLKGLRDIWSYVVRGAMAVGIGERFENGNKRLWLFRNQFRSVWLADMREQLGQIFFFSTPDIWQSAVSSIPSIRKYTNRAKLIELPTEEIWVFNTSPKNPVVLDSLVSKFDVFQGDFKFAEHDGDPIEVENNVPTSEIYTKLNDDEEVVGVNNYSKPLYPIKTGYQGYSYGCRHGRENENPRPYYDSDPNLGDYWNGLEEIRRSSESDSTVSPSIDSFFLDENSTRMSVENLQLACKRLKDLIEQVEINAQNKLLEASMSEGDYNDLMSSIETAELELKGTIQLMGNH